MNRNRWLVLAVTFIFSLSLIVFTVSAEETNISEHILFADDLAGSEYFQPITREEYISELASSQGISYSMAAQMIDNDIEAALASIPAPMSWIGDTAVDNGDTTSTVYGKVYCNYYDPSGMSVTYSVQAVLIQSHYGSTWVRCDPTGRFTPGSGVYSFYGDCTANIITNRQLRLVLDGYFEIAYSTSNAVSFDFEVLEYSRSEGLTTYYRKDIYQVHIETTSIQGG